MTRTAPLGGIPAGAIRAGDFKLTAFFEVGHSDLYNLREDGGELRDLSMNLAGCAGTFGAGGVPGEAGNWTWAA